MSFYTSFQNYFHSFVPSNPENQGEKLQGKQDIQGEKPQVKEIKDPSPLDTRVCDSSQLSFSEHPVRLTSSESASSEKLVNKEHIEHEVKQLSSAELKEINQLAKETISYLTSYIINQSPGNRSSTIEKNLSEGIRTAEKVIQATESEKKSRSQEPGRSTIQLIDIGRQLGIPVSKIFQDSVLSGKGKKDFKEQLARAIHEKVKPGVDKGELTVPGKNGDMQVEQILMQLGKVLGREIAPTATKAWENKYGGVADHFRVRRDEVQERGVRSQEWLMTYNTVAHAVQASPLFAWAPPKDKEVVTFFLPTGTMKKETVETLKLSQLCREAKNMAVDLKETAGSTVKSFVAQVEGAKTSLQSTLERKLAERLLDKLETNLANGVTKEKGWNAEKSVAQLMELSLPKDLAERRMQCLKETLEINYPGHIETLAKSMGVVLSQNPLSEEEVQKCLEMSRSIDCSPLGKYVNLQTITSFFSDPLHMPMSPIDVMFSEPVEIAETVEESGVMAETPETPRESSLIGSHRNFSLQYFEEMDVSSFEEESDPYINMLNAMNEKLEGRAELEGPTEDNFESENLALVQNMIQELLKQAQGTLSEEDFKLPQQEISGEGEEPNIPSHTPEETTLQSPLPNVGLGIQEGEMQEIPAHMLEEESLQSSQPKVANEEKEFKIPDKMPELPQVPNAAREEKEFKIPDTMPELPRVPRRMPELPQVPLNWEELLAKYQAEENLGAKEEIEASSDLKIAEEAKATPDKEAEANLKWEQDLAKFRNLAEEESKTEGKAKTGDAVEAKTGEKLTKEEQLAKYEAMEQAEAKLDEEAKAKMEIEAQAKIEKEAKAKTDTGAAKVTKGPQLPHETITVRSYLRSVDSYTFNFNPQPFTLSEYKAFNEMLNDPSLLPLIKGNDLQSAQEEYSKNMKMCKESLDAHKKLFE